MAPLLLLAALVSASPTDSAQVLSNQVRRELAGAIERKDAAAAARAMDALAEMGASLTPASQARVAPITGPAPEHQWAARFAANAAPVGGGSAASSIPARFGIIEGLARDPKRGTLYASSASHGVLLRQGPGGWEAVPLELAADGLFGMAFDARRGWLWVTAGSPTPDKASGGWRGVVAVDPGTGKIVKRLAAPAGTNPGDVVMLADRGVLVSDGGGALLKAGPEDAALHALKLSAPLKSPQGMVVRPDGKVVVADYSEGLVLLDPKSGWWDRFATAGSMMLDGIDGLTAGPDGSVWAIQNGTRPVRVVRVRFNREALRIDGVEVVARNAWTGGEPTLGAVGPGGLTYVATSQWGRLEKECPDPRACRYADTELRVISGK